MTRPLLLTSFVAFALAAVVLAGAWTVVQPGGPPLVEAEFSLAAISPNADGDRDVSNIRYVLRRPATVSIYFTDSSGTRYYFRKDKPREAGEHTVDFSGVVAPFLRPGEAIEGELLARVLPDGQYTWVVEADDGQMPIQQITGSLAIEQADTALPLLNMTVHPQVFTPNQDGLTDRTNINVHLAKDIPEGGLRVWLIDEAGVELAIAEKVSAIRFGARGNHLFDYDGGIDQGFEPPPDGTYTVRAEAEDTLGQKVAVEQTLTIAMGGLPRADIVQGLVDWSATSVIYGQTLYFTLTVENYSTAPIRTSGPFSGHVYDSMHANANTIGQYVQSGAWRVGINCDTCESDYPWRWALGTPENLTVIPDEKGQPQYYLMPGETAQVTGGIVLDRVIASRNPQTFWAGLIHEDVEIALVNSHVSPEWIEIIEPR